MAQPKPEIGDIWMDNVWGRGDKWLILDKYVSKQHNTHMVLLRNLREEREIELKAVYIRQMWERLV